MSKIKSERKKKEKKKKIKSLKIWSLGDKVRNSLLCNDLTKGVVIGLDTKMKIVYGWYSAENDESTEISKWKKKGGKKKWRTVGSNPGVPSYNTNSTSAFTH